MRYCLVSRPGLPSGGGSDRGAYRIEILSLSTGPVVRGTCVPDLPIIPTHKCATRVRNVSIYRYTAAGTACSGNDGGVPGCLL